MEEEDFELTLFDRIEVIRTTIQQYGEENFYLSFSGGKDSIVLHHLIDMAIPGNRIPRVYINTGIEYVKILQFVRQLAKEDDRIQIINSSVPIKKMLEEKGYPFKSKEHSKMVSVFQNGSSCRSVDYYLGKEGHKMLTCPKALLYQFTEDFKIKISDKCCTELKKKSFKKWICMSHKTIAITGLRKEEGGVRAAHSGCMVFDKNEKLKYFKPLNPISEAFENWLISKFKIELCELYYPPYNFKRTGCKGCPFSLDLQEQLEIMEHYLPTERRQCEIIWNKIYDEYRRIGYRLSKEEQLKLF